MTRTSGSNAGLYPINIGALAISDGNGGNNYNLTFVSKDFEIKKRAASWTTDPASKTYGDADPSPLTTGSGTNFVAADNVTATYSRAAGENAGLTTYHITATLSATPAAALDNYTITNNGAEFTINKRVATWTTDPNSKTYGDADPSPLTTGSGSNFVAADNVSATYSRVAGETAGATTYHITATLTATPAAALDNYIITNAGAEFTINKRLATWTTNPNSKTYGDPDPDPITTGSGSNFVAADNVTASYSRVLGENASASTYHITATLNAAPGVLDNYTVTNAGAEFTINKRLATWTTSAASKTYGDTDPAGLTTGSGTNFVGADNVSATYARDAGESASPPTYHITATLSATPLSALDNYIITNAGAEFTINKRAATWTTNPNSKTYGSDDPIPLTTGSGSNFVSADNVAATYARTPGEDLSGNPYHITATLSAATAGALDNYTIINNGANFTIAAATIKVDAVASSKEYGEDDPDFDYTLSGFKLTDDEGDVTGSAVCTRAPIGENVAGVYSITCSTGNLASPNYIFETGEVAAFTINPAVLRVNAVANSKTYGDADPAFGFTLSGFKLDENATTAGVTGDPVCDRTLGETAGLPYTITCAPGNLAAANYVFTAGNAAQFVINKRLATWITNPNSKTYGDPDPAPVTTGSGSNFVAADSISATYSRVAGEQASPPTYHITATLLDPNGKMGNYIVTNDGAEFTINKRLATWTTNPNSKTYGDADPSPLTTGSGSNFVAADNVTATYSRAPGENASVSTYHITATLSATPSSALSNYILTNDGAEFTILKRSATWTTDPNSKIYGDADPAPLTTGSGSNFVAADNVTATYSRVAGENASLPTYHITATLSSAPGALDNYNLTNAGAEFTINKRQATWNTNPASKTYGDADPAGITTGSGTNFVAADNVTAVYSRTAGENASPPTYHITAALSATPLSALDNYIITNDGADFTIDKRVATWTTQPNSKTYGEADPNPLTSGSGDFLPADGVTASYSRGPGETVAGGPYLITAALSSAVAGALDNYSVTNAGASFTINTRAATWTTQPSSKTYGDSDPVGLTAGSGSNFIPADNVTATYSRVAGENASPPTYHITATLSSPVPSALSNYSVTNAGAEFTINKRSVTVTPNFGQYKIWGTTDPALTYTFTPALGFSDSFSGTLTRVAGEQVGLYEIKQGTLSLSSNYTLTVTTGVNFEIKTAFCFNGFLSPVGGSVESGNGGSSLDPIRSFKMNSTIPFKFVLYDLSCTGTPVTTGVQKIQMFKYNSTTDAYDTPIDATPTDAATTGQEFRLTGTEWHYNLDTKKTQGITTGTWLVKALLYDGSVRSVWISIKK